MSCTLYFRNVCLEEYLLLSNNALYNGVFLQINNRWVFHCNSPLKPLCFISETHHYEEMNMGDRGGQKYEQLNVRDRGGQKYEQLNVKDRGGQKYEELDVRSGGEQEYEVMTSSKHSMTS